MRLFIALEFSEELKAYFKDLQDRLPKDTIKASYPKDYHLTLLFLGEVEENRLEEIKKILSRITFKEITIETTAIGFFPNENSPRVLWLGLKENKELMALQRQIATSFHEYTDGKQFHPHITLARIHIIKDRQEFQEKMKTIQLKTQKQAINKFSLIKSTLTPPGPLYETMIEYPAQE